MRAIAGPRFGVETTFIVGVAVVGGLLELPLSAVVVAVFGAWVVVTLAEVAVSRHAAGHALRPVEPPEPDREPERPPLAAVPVPGPEPLREPAGEREAAPAPASAPAPEPPRAWNVWELERRLQSQPAAAAGDLAYLLLYLREYANAEGVLPVEFDALVRESFGELVEADP